MGPAKSDAVESLVLEYEEEALSPAQIEHKNKIEQKIEVLNKHIQGLHKEIDSISKDLSGDTLAQQPHVSTQVLPPQSAPAHTSSGQTAGQPSQNYVVVDSHAGLVAMPTSQVRRPPAAANPVRFQTPTSSSFLRATPPQSSIVPRAMRGGTAIRQRRPNIVRAVANPRMPSKTDIMVKRNLGIDKNTEESSDVVDLTDEDLCPETEVVSKADTKEVTISPLSEKTFPSLVVLARPNMAPKQFTNSQVQLERSSLDDKVKQVLTLSTPKYIEWLLQHGLLRSEQECNSNIKGKIHQPLKLGMYSDTSKFPYSGGYVWISECCTSHFLSVFSGSLFEATPHSPTVVLKLIYHWACQTAVQNVIQWVKVDNLFIKTLYTNLRAICTAAIHQRFPVFGGPYKRVQVGVISLGTTAQDGTSRQVKVEILGIFDESTQMLRIRAIEPITIDKSADQITIMKRRFQKALEPLLRWVHKSSEVLIDCTVDKGTLISYGYSKVLQSTSEQPYGYKIMDYLKVVIPRMFQNTLSLLSRQIIQQFLDELVWREAFGPIPSRAFDSIIEHTSEQTRLNSGGTLVNRLSRISLNPFRNWEYDRWVHNCRPTVVPTLKNEPLQVQSITEQQLQHQQLQPQKLHYQQQLQSQETPSGSEDNYNLKKTPYSPLMENIDFLLYDYSDNDKKKNSAFQQCPNYRVPNLQQVQCDKCDYICDLSILAEHEANAHSVDQFVKVPQTENPYLDSQKVVYHPQSGKENILLEQRYNKKENGNQSADFDSVSTSMSSPTNCEKLYFEQSQMIQHLSPQLPEYNVISGGGCSWKLNEARKPTTLNCSTCKKWFTNYSHLKRHYKTALHKKAIKQSNAANMLVNRHHHPPLHESKFQSQPQQEQQEEFHDFYKYTNGMAPQTTNFIIDMLPGFNQIQNSRSGYSNVGGHATVSVMPSIQENFGVSDMTTTSVLHKCIECDKTFNKACYLTQHNNSFHSGYKPFKCAQCGKRFSHEYLRQEHVQKHIGDKPYKCKLCPKQFIHKIDLCRHMVLHSGKMPFTCGFCNKGFIRKDHMRKHVQIHKKKKKSLLPNYKKIKMDSTRFNPLSWKPATPVPQVVQTKKLYSSLEAAASPSTSSTYPKIQPKKTSSLIQQLSSETSPLGATIKTDPNETNSLPPQIVNLPTNKSRSGGPEPAMIALEPYYYGILEGDSSRHRYVPFFTQCYLCRTDFKSVLKLTDHLILHALNKDLESVNDPKDICKICLKIRLPGSKQHHIQMCQPSITGLSCRICALKMKDNGSLIYHMTKTHHQLDMPYHCSRCNYRVSELHMLNAHFAKAHFNATSGMCPFCLKLVDFATPSGDDLEHNQVFFIKHIQRHVLPSSKKCTRCLLNFINKALLAEHEALMHSSCVDNDDVMRYLVDNPILMPAPIAEPALVHSLQPVDMKPASQLKGISTVSLRVIADLINDVCCHECESPITSDHLSNFLMCNKCSYRTCCPHAIAEHVSQMHPPYPLSSPVFIGMKVTISNKAYCSACSFSSRDGNIMSKHLVTCGDGTCIVGRRRPVLKPEEMESLPLQTFGKKRGRKTRGRDDKQHKSILNLLGLVRKEEDASGSGIESEESSLQDMPQLTEELSSSHITVVEDDECMEVDAC